MHPGAIFTMQVLLIYAAAYPLPSLIKRILYGRRLLTLEVGNRSSGNKPITKDAFAAVGWIRYSLSVFTWWLTSPHYSLYSGRLLIGQRVERLCHLEVFIFYL